MVTRRTFLLGATGLAGAAAAGFGAYSFLGGHAEATTGPIARSDAEWRKILTPQQYAVLRHESTERPWSSPLVDEHRKGRFACSGCQNPVFSSETKFESGTGWPSFWAPIQGAVATKIDRNFFMERTEVHCARCGGHLGHIFDDGPPPTHKRYCINGVALSFVAA